MTTKRKIIYTPPDKDSLRRYARRVCWQLEIATEAGFNDAEVVDGLTDFLVQVAKMQAKRYSHQDAEQLQEGFDNDSVTR